MKNGQLTRFIRQVGKYKDLGYMRGDPKEHKIKLLIKQLKNLGVDVQHHNHQLITSVKKVNVDITGIILT